MLVYALDAARLPAKRGAEIAPPSNNVVVDTLSLDAPHHHSLVKRVTGAFTLSEPQHCGRVVEHQVVRDAFPNSVKDAPEVVRQTKSADVLVVDLSGAGTVVEVGSSVTDLKPGDDVFGIALGCLQTYATTDRRLLARQENGWAFTAAAALPTVYTTVDYAFSELAKLKKGEQS